MGYFGLIVQKNGGYCESYDGLRGLVFDKFNEIQELDMVEAYIMVEVPR